MSHQLQRLLLSWLFLWAIYGAQAELLHRYSFTNGDTEAVDSVGGQDGTLENGAFISDNAVQLDGSNQYVDLPGNLIADFNSLTIESWFVHSANGGWTRLFDFGNISGSIGEDYLFFSPQSGGADSRWVIADGQSEQIVSISTLNFDESVYLVCVYNDNDSTMTIYVNGSLANSISVSIPLSTISNAYRFLGRSLYSADPYLKGSIDEFRIYNHALDSDEILYNYTAGPDLLDYEHTVTNPVPEKNALSVNTTTELSWLSPSEIPDSYTVYVSENSDLSSAQVFEVTSGTSCDPDLQSETKYYWRVDTNYGATSHTGIVWNFTTCTTAFEDIPPGDWNGDYEVSLADLMMLAESWLNDADLFTYIELSENWLVKEPALIINEFMADNDELFADPDASVDEFDDWIEIYNRSSVPQDLGGMYLTDDLDTPDKWMIPNGVTVGAYDYVLFWADSQPEQGERHTNFSLDAGGEEIGLFDTDGITLLDSIEFGSQPLNMSSGRFPDNASVWNLFAVPSPEKCNCQGYDGVIEEVEFSADGGIFSDSSEAFDVYLSCDTTDAVIRYTTDFTEPTESSTEYTGSPIHVDSTTCLRATAFKSGWYPAGTVSRTYVFLDNVMSQSANPSGFPSGAADYEVDPDVVGDPAYSGTFKDDLKTVPSVCIVLPNDSLFGSTGIYTNYNSRGDAWERATSIEVIDPATNDYYQANAGIRINGGVGRNAAKKSFRIIFRGLYGPSKMEHPLFEDSDVEVFDQLVLRATWNYSWGGECNGTENTRAQYMREVYAHDTIRDMGRLQGYIRHVHLYINGLYWGMYILTERPDEGFAAEHLGGSKSDYDVIKTDSLYWTGPQIIELLSGDRQAWDQLYALAAGDMSDSNNYAAIQDYVDIPALIDYMLMIFHIGSRDAPTLLNTWTHPRNFYAIRKRQPGAGFVFLPWDCEWSLEGSSDNVVNQPYEGGYENPAYLFVRLADNDEFRMLVADHVHKFYFNDGVLAEDNTIARYWSRVMDIDRAIVGESARWGDNCRSTPYTRDVEWVSERDRLVGSYLPVRDEVVLSQLQALGYYPTVDAPVFYINGSYQHGGYVDSGDTFSMTTTSGTIWYTVDGSDPRLPGSSPGSTTLTFAAEAADKRVLVPDEDIGTDWCTDTSFDDSGWDVCSGSPGGVGYETSSGYQNMISLDMEEEMYGSGKNTTCYIRIPFTVDAQDLGDLASMTLKIRYDDAFVAYINGTEVARRNFTGTPEWDSNADVDTHEAQQAPNWDEYIDITSYISELQAGDNILAIHGMNAGSTSSDFLICAELTADTGGTPEGVSPTALEYTGPFTLSASTHVKARALDGSTWSALNEAVYVVGPVTENLRITELMYHPADPNTEFIELQNIGDDPINPALVSFTNGVDFTFPSMTIPSEGYVLVVEDPNEFRNKYGIGLDGIIAGQYEGSLDNGGEGITLVDPIGTIIHDFNYQDTWCEITDGDGFSLTIIDPESTDPNLWDSKDGWRPSAMIDGSPGSDDSGYVYAPGSVVINEVLAHTDFAPNDWIELHNTTDDPIPVGGWFLSDRANDDPNYMKYRIVDGTTIAAGGYLVITQDDHFGNPSDPGCIVPFALSENGETVYLRSGAGNSSSGYYLTGYFDQEDFGASEVGVAFGRYIKSVLDGGVNFVAMSTNTPGSLTGGTPYFTGAANAYPKVGPILINEIYYNPEDGGSYDHDEYEYIELYNISGSTVSLQEYDNVLHTNIPWKFTDAIDYTFPLETSISAGSKIVVVKNPTAFSERYPSVSGSIIYGPYDGKLDNGGEKLELGKPGDEVDGVRYYIRIDRVSYDDEAPWPLTPVSPDGGGYSLHQKTPDTVGANYGNDVINWEANTPSPGT